MSKLTKNQLSKLKDLLPYGYARKLSEMLTKSNGKKYSENHIRKSLMFEHQNPKIIKGAVELAEKEGVDPEKIKMTIENW